MHKEGVRQIVYERIGILLSLAQKALKAGDEKYAKRYISLARKLSTRYNCRLSPKQKMQFCKKCGLPLIAGKNLTVRLRARTRRAEYRCSCGHVARFKY